MEDKYKKINNKIGNKAVGMLFCVVPGVVLLTEKALDASSKEGVFLYSILAILLAGLAIDNTASIINNVGKSEEEMKKKKDAINSLKNQIRRNKVR